jgi:hypothetical protein
MIRIDISQEAFEAVAKTLPVCSVMFEPKVTDEGMLDDRMADRLEAMRQPGEDY